MFNIESKRVWLFFSYLSLLIFNSFFSYNVVLIKNLWKYDKLIHFGEYFILGFLLFNVLFESIFSKKKLICYIVFITIIPIIDESIQIFIPHRVFSVYDLIADYVGICFGCYLYYKYYNMNNG